MTLMPAYEAMGPVIGLLRADPELQALLFSETPSISPEDHRVWSAYVRIPDSLPDSAEIRDAMPRVLVDIAGEPHQTEQAEGDMAAMLTITTHVHTESGDRATGEQIRGRLVALLTSTSLNGPTIMGAGIVLAATPPPVREPEWRDAWRLTTVFTVGIAGVV